MDAKIVYVTYIITFCLLNNVKYQMYYCFVFVDVIINATFAI